MTTDRADMITYTQPYYINSVTFTTPLTENSGYSSSFFGAFDQNIWSLIFVSMFIIYIISIVWKYFNITGQNINKSAISILLIQPVLSFDKKLLSVKILLFSWILTCLVLRNYYCGSLYTLITFPLNSERIETIDELTYALKNKDIRIVTLAQAAYEPDIPVSQYHIISYHKLLKFN